MHVSLIKMNISNLECKRNYFLSEEVNISIMEDQIHSCMIFCTKKSVFILLTIIRLSFINMFRSEISMLFHVKCCILQSNNGRMR